jgi:putative hydrolase of HD superfamily
MKTGLDALLRFVTMTNTFRTVERVVSIQDDTRPENDLEHSAQLAFVAWYLLDTHTHTLDRELVLRYALIHDLVEVYAGDTMFFDHAAHADKKERELAALERIRTEFPSSRDLTGHIERYELRADPESRFVYALDKLLPMLNIYLSGGRMWKEHGITFEMQRSKKAPLVKDVPIVEPLYNALSTRLKAEEPTLFAMN